MSDAVIQIPSKALFYEIALEGLTRLDEQLLTLGRFPPIYSAGVEYRREPSELWKNVNSTITDGWGDCEDLAAWRAAELRVSGEDPNAFVHVYRSGRRSFHAVVGRWDGRIEDPSLALGMRVSAKRRLQMPQFVGDNYAAAGAGDQDQDEGQDDQDGDQGPPGPDVAPKGPARPGSARRAFGAAMQAQRLVNPLSQARLARSVLKRFKLWGEPCCGIGPDPIPNNPQISFDVFRHGRGWSGIVRVPTGAGRALLMQSSPSSSPRKAEKKGLNLAKAAASNPALKAMMPPQAQLAMKVLQIAPKGQALKVLRRFGR